MSHFGMENDAIISIKVRHLTNVGEAIARKLPIHRNIGLEDLELKIRERFEISNEKKIQLCYTEEQDRVIISYDDELYLSLQGEKTPTFDLMIKSKVIGNTFLYPQPLKGSPGELIDVWIASEYLTIDHALNEATKAWGTHIYTDDSDLVKVLLHSEKILLDELPPRYNVVVTVRLLPGCIKYIGSACHGIITNDYPAYGTSIVIEGVRTVPLVPEKNNYL
ncbi:590_t:CDS:2 [Ambispora gerdemannii]|uniref:590_t:CDS:1 n=1 Tax=Ambispora gerdemannii TaxID=144530 RepID=A0A9N8W1G1_9GLOM|nr:590_t:CDS:2 [Ambispora gerdemannii]